MKGFYNELKEVWGLKKKGPVQHKSTDRMEAFYNQLARVLSGIPPTDKLLLMGDFNDEVSG